MGTTTKLSSREVLLYLNDLGYTNINQQQLKEFMQDLKKLIKYEERKRFQEGSINSQQEYLQEYVDNIPSVQDTVDEIFSNLHMQQTVASKAKIVLKKQKTISVQIKRTNFLPLQSQQTCEHSEVSKTVICNNAEESEQKVLKENQVQLEKVGTVRLDDGDHARSAISSKKCTRKNSLKPKASFIRPGIQINMKSDPVALYHQYQAEWKRKKIPGEDNRADLRWAIREKMLGGPKFIR